MSAHRRLLCPALATIGYLALGCQEPPVNEPDVRIDRLPSGGGGCYVVCDHQTLPADGGPALGTPCTGDLAVSSCGFAGGADQIRVVTSLGPVQIDRLLGSPKADVSLLLDGEPKVLSPIVDTSEPFPDGTTIFTTQLLAPAQQVNNLRVQVKLADSFFSDPDVSFSVTPPQPVIDFTCENDPCRAAVDRIDVMVTAPAGLAGKTATLKTKINGVYKGFSDTATLKQIFAHDSQSVQSATATFSLTAPSDASTVTFEAQVDAFLADPKTLTLGVPVIDHDAKGCTGSGGECIRGVDKISVVVRAPAAFAGKSATVTTFVDDLFSSELGNQMLDKVGDFAEKTVTFAVPPTGSMLRISSRVEAFQAADDLTFGLRSPDLSIDVVGCDSAPCALVLGVDQVGVTITTHKQLAGTNAKVSLAVDSVYGAPVDVPLALENDAAVGHWTQPKVKIGEKLTINAQVTGSEEKFKEVALHPPPLTLSVVGCLPGAVCLRERGVGMITAKLVGPYPLAGETALFTTDVDGSPRDQKTKTLGSEADDGGSAQSTATVEFLTPSDGAHVLLNANVLGYPVDPVIIDLTAPQLSLALEGCPAPCSLQPGDAATFVLYARYDILDINAAVFETLNGTPSSDSTSLLLGIQDLVCPDGSFSDGCRYGFKKLIVPDNPGKQWQLRGYIGPASVESPIITIAPPPP